MAGTTVNLDQFETRELLELTPRAVGTYKAQMMIRGNSILSSVFVKSISPGATLQVNYYDTTTGSEDLSERYDLQGHAEITDLDVGKTFRVLVSRIHNKPIIEAVVTGGTVEFGVYVTVVSDFPQDSATLSVSGKVTAVDLIAGQWTKLPTTAGRSAISIINRTGQQIKINYDNTIPSYVGVPVEDGQDRNYDIKATIVQYAKPELSNCTILVEELG